MFTVREIKDVLKQEHLSISKRRGQNFLVDERVKKRIIDALDLNPTDYILEIGPGLGALTEDLARRALKVFAVEKDRALARILQKLLSYKNLEIIHQDILKTDIEKICKKRIKVIGNLPFYITTPIIGYLLEKQAKKIKEILITVQNEVGKRIVAKPGGKDYSAITIFVQYFANSSLLFSIPKRAFYPQPKVDSVFVHLRILKEPRVSVNSQEQFFKIIHAAFNQRRKIILNSLLHKSGRVEKNKIQKILEKAGVDSQLRPERLSIYDFARIEDSFFRRGIRI